MKDLAESDKMEYFRCSYRSVDGLWFMMIEKKRGFDEALELDEAVWRVLPKIQARTIKSMLKLDYGLDGLKEAIAARLALEEFDFELKEEEGGFAVEIRRCPWHDAMVRSGREELSEKVSEVICQAENSVWAQEFSHKGTEGDGKKIKFERQERLCQGSNRCRLRFDR
ncbi:DUF6125 family protein [Methanothrix sp.]|uniref:DUF6125 family protein n=1 Tax=Methanothrix sp. TaxID=90426 RepID=UPI003BB777D0